MSFFLKYISIFKYTFYDIILFGLLLNENHLFSIIGAIVLFSVLAYSTNSIILNSTDRNLYIEYLNAAVSVSQSCINQIREKPFDEKTITSIVTNTEFSQSLGPDGENYPNFDDIDDYNGYVFNDINTKYAGTFNSSIKVIYVDPGSLIKSSVPTRMKKITVATFSKSLPDTVKINYYSSY